MSQPLMPKATTVWLIEDTTLTFKQIAAVPPRPPYSGTGTV